MAETVDRAIRQITETIKEIRRTPSSSNSTQDGDHFSISFRPTAPAEQKDEPSPVPRHDRSA
jgi:hypothetical protein